MTTDRPVKPRNYAWTSQAEYARFHRVVTGQTAVAAAFTLPELAGLVRMYPPLADIIDTPARRAVRYYLDHHDFAPRTGSGVPIFRSETR